MPEKKCGDCVHWRQKPPDPMALGAEPEGECREGPPALTSLPVNGGRQIVKVIGYPELAAGFSACDRYRSRVEPYAG